MKLALSATQKNKIGTCPHGLPQGACPICSGMGGGGGGGSSKKADKSSNEMSWSECYVAWQQILKAKDNSLQRKNESIQAQMISQYKMQLSLGSAAQKMANFAEKLTNFTRKVQSDSPFTSKLLAFGAKLAIPVLNGLKDILAIADKALNAVKGKLADISDKLNAIFGELKNSIEKKISDRLKDFKKKIKSLFGILDTEDVDDEEKRVEENNPRQRLFEFKTVLNKIKEKFTPKKTKE